MFLGIQAGRGGAEGAIALPTPVVDAEEADVSIERERAMERERLKEREKLDQAAERERKREEEEKERMLKIKKMK